MTLQVSAESCKPSFPGEVYKTSKPTPLQHNKEQKPSISGTWTWFKFLQLQQNTHTAAPRADTSTLIAVIFQQWWQQRHG